MENISQNKKYWCTNNIKRENNEFLKVSIKNRTCYNFNDVIKFENFGFDTKKSNENILIYGVSYKTLICAKALRSMFKK